MLPPLTVEIIDLFVAAARLLGFPRSLGEIYGLLFISTAPLTLDEIITKLTISKGSASQGLRTLRQLGAVRVIYQPGDRRDHHVAETELKKLVAGFITGQMLPHLETGQARLERIKHLGEEAAASLDLVTQQIQQERIQKLEQWHQRARMLAPILSKVIG